MPEVDFTSTARTVTIRVTHFRPDGKVMCSRTDCNVSAQIPMALLSRHGGGSKKVGLAYRRDSCSSGVSGRGEAASHTALIPIKTTAFKA